MSLPLLLAACATTPDDSAPEPVDTGERADLDGDGFAAPEDCDDTDAEVFPGAYEPLDDGGVDRDCNGHDDAFSKSRDAYIWVVPSPDIDGDGRADFLVYDYLEEYVVFVVDAADKRWVARNDFYFPSPVDDIDGDGLAEVVGIVHWEDGLGPAVALYTGEFLARQHASPSLLEHEVVCEYPNFDGDLRQVDDMDGDGVAELQIGFGVFPITRLVSTPCVLGDPSYRFPEGPTHPRFESGDIDGDGLGDLLQPGLIYPAASLSPGGTYYASDGISVPGLEGYVEDVNGDGLGDVWLYDDAGYGQVELAVAPTRLGDTATTFAAVVGSEAFFVPEEAGPIGDVDQDGRVDVGIGAQIGGPAEPWEAELQEVRLFAATAMSGTVDIEASPRRIAVDGYRFTYEDFDGDSVADPAVLGPGVLGPGDLWVIGWAPIFP